MALSAVLYEYSSLPFTKEAAPSKLLPGVGRQQNTSSRRTCGGGLHDDPEHLPVLLRHLERAIDEDDVLAMRDQEEALCAWTDAHHDRFAADAADNVTADKVPEALLLWGCV